MVLEPTQPGHRDEPLAKALRSVAELAIPLGLELEDVRSPRLEARVQHELQLP